MSAATAASFAGLTLAERHELHPHEFEVRDGVRQAHALAVLIPGGCEAGASLTARTFRDALAGVAELLHRAREALALTTPHAGTVTATDVPETVADLVNHHLFIMLEGLPDALVHKTLVQAYELVHLTGTADDAQGRETVEVSERPGPMR